MRQAFAQRHRLREEAISLWREGCELSDDALVAFYRGRYVHEPVMLLSLARPGLLDPGARLLDGPHGTVGPRITRGRGSSRNGQISFRPDPRQPLPRPALVTMNSTHQTPSWS